MSCCSSPRYEELETKIIERDEFIYQMRKALDHNERAMEHMQNTLHEQKKKLDAFYKCSSQTMKESGSQEDTNDEFSNTRLAERFDGSLRSQWLDICDELLLVINEIQYLTILSGIMETVSEHTAQTVYDTERNLVQLAHFANEDQNEVRHTIRVLRQRLGQKQSTRDNVVKDIVAKVKEEDMVRNLLTQHKVSDATAAAIERFIYDFADICWLMYIGNPPLKLNFDVKGEDYKNINNQFVEYAFIEHCKCDGKLGAVYLVAWPSMELEDNSGFLTKGEAIVCK